MTKCAINLADIYHIILAVVHSMMKYFSKCVAILLSDNQCSFHTHQLSSLSFCGLMMKSVALCVYAGQRISGT